MAEKGGAGLSGGSLWACGGAPILDCWAWTEGRGCLPGWSSDSTLDTPLTVVAGALECTRVRSTPPCPWAAHWLVPVGNLEDPCGAEVDFLRPWSSAAWLGSASRSCWAPVGCSGSGQLGSDPLSHWLSLRLESWPHCPRPSGPGLQEDTVQAVSAVATWILIIIGSRGCSWLPHVPPNPAAFFGFNKWKQAFCLIHHTTTPYHAMSECYLYWLSWIETPWPLNIPKLSSSIDMTKVKEHQHRKLSVSRFHLKIRIYFNS